MDSLTLHVEGSGTGLPYGYSDGVDAGGQKYLYTKQTIGTNWAKGMPFTISRAPSGFQSSAPASNTTILTDGVVGSPVTGSFSYWLGQCWVSGSNVDLRVDLGQPRATGAFRAHVFGYPGWDALKGRGSRSHRSADVARRHGFHQPRCAADVALEEEHSRSTTCCRTMRRRQHGISN